MNWWSNLHHRNRPIANRFPSSTLVSLFPTFCIFVLLGKIVIKNLPPCPDPVLNKVVLPKQETTSCKTEESDVDIEKDVDVEEFSDAENASASSPSALSCEDEQEVEEYDDEEDAKSKSSNGNKNSNNKSGRNKKKSRSEPVNHLIKPKCNCDELTTVDCQLETKELWDKFHELGTEMIITKTGRWVGKHRIEWSVHF